MQNNLEQLISPLFSFSNDEEFKDIIVDFAFCLEEFRIEPEYLAEVTYLLNQIKTHFDLIKMDYMPYDTIETQLINSINDFISFKNIVFV